MLRFALVSPKKNQQKWNEEIIKKWAEQIKKITIENKVKADSNGNGNVRLILRNSNTTKH